MLMLALEKRERTNPTTLARLAWIAYQMGYPTRAAAVLDEAIALNPTEKDTRREIGDTLVATQRSETAMKWFETMVKNYPIDRELKMRLAEVTAYAEHYTLALERTAELLYPDPELKDVELQPHVVQLRRCRLFREDADDRRADRSSRADLGEDLPTQGPNSQRPVGLHLAHGLGSLPRKSSGSWSIPGTPR